MKGIPLSKYYSLLKEYLAPMRLKVIALSVVMLINITLQIINPQIIRYYLDNVAEDVSLSTLRNAALLYMVFVIIQFGLQIINVYISQTIAWTSTNALRSSLLNHCVSLDMSFHNEFEPGQMIERVDGDVNSLSNFFSNLALLFLSNLLLIVGILIALFIESITLGLIFTVFTIFALVVSYFARTLVVPYFKKWRESSMQLFGYIEERIGGTEDIRALGAEDYVLEKYYDRERDLYDIILRAILWSRLISITFIGLAGFGVTLVYVVGVPRVENGDITLGTLFLMTTYVGLLIQPIFTILRQIQNLQEADASIERIEELFALEPKIVDSGLKQINGDVPNLIFDRVNFAYHEDNQVLKNISFELPAGKTLGLIGRTGSGKTTISRLIFRLYEPQSGKILLQGNNIEEYKLENLRENIAMVTQDVQLFDTTLRNNVTFFDESFPDEIIIQTIERVGLKEWFDNQEEGLDTRISSSQSGLSAGEAQLLALSRIFLKNPAVIILDEASSRLDPLTEKYLDQAIDAITKDQTTIIIAHRLETLKKVDQILVLEDGVVKEFGDRIQLAKDPKSRYAEILRTGELEVMS